MRAQLVVGGAGFIGSALVRQLLESGPVRVLDDLSTGRAENVDGLEGVDLIEGSMLDEELVNRLAREADVVFHLACLGVRHSIAHPVANHEANARGTLNLLEAARAAGTRRFVYTSTSEVYGTALRVPMDEDHPTYPHTVYGGSKLAGEAYVRAYHRTYSMATVVLRPFNAYGPRSHHEGDSGEVIPKFIVRAMNGLAPIVFGDGTQTRDFTYVEDTARAIAAAADRDDAIGETINVGSGSEIAIVDLAEMILRATGRSDIAPVHVDPRPGDILRLIADSQRARVALTWEPDVPLGEGIRRLLSWHDARDTDWAAALSEDVPRNWEDERA